MPKRQTTARVSKIAARVLRVGHPLDEAKLRDQLREAVMSARPPVGIVSLQDARTAAADAMIDAMGACLRPLFEDMATLAASCLSQDEEAAGHD